ncbi:MAG TPA: hypothetical protein VMD75_03220 [Candidatus Binataceae bacterium]|nr:hypothetical protein [Candidatus Binataceae bacterium]
MKLPDVYGDWRIIAGLAMLLLGGANWVIGLERTTEYAQIIAQASTPPVPDEAYRSFDELDAGSTVLEPFTSAERRVSYATARMDFYHATYLTGRVLVSIGLVTMLIGFITVIHRDTRRTIRRIRMESNGDGP